jgi:hypothetical protein
MLSLVLYLLGALTALLGFLILIRRQRWLRETVVTPGTIVGVDEKATASGVRRTFPVVQYQADGRTFQYRSPVPLPDAGTGRVGQALPIRYLRAEPGQARLDSPLSVWLAPALFMALGLGLVLLGRWVA